MSENAKILDKIKKCLALSASSNEHEAAAALRQARKLMEAYGITDLDVQAAQAEERRAKAGAKSSPSNWESMLAVKVGDAFACKVVFSPGWRAGEWCFIGCGASPEVANYAFAVLNRQAKRAREEHIKTKLKRCKTATKTRRADLFSEGWVRSVTGAISAFTGSEQQTTAIDAFMVKHYPSLHTLKTRNRNDGRNLSDREIDDYAAGSRSGRDVQLNHGVGGAEQQLAIGSAA
jgi:hypothetical protein